MEKIALFSWQLTLIKFHTHLHSFFLYSVLKMIVNDFKLYGRLTQIFIFTYSSIFTARETGNLSQILSVIIQIRQNFSVCNLAASNLASINNREYFPFKYRDRESELVSGREREIVWERKREREREACGWGHREKDGGKGWTRERGRGGEDLTSMVVYIVLSQHPA